MKDGKGRGNKSEYKQSEPVQVTRGTHICTIVGQTEYTTPRHLKFNEYQGGSLFYPSLEILPLVEGAVLVQPTIYRRWPSQPQRSKSTHKP